MSIGTVLHMETHCLMYMLKSSSDDDNVEA